MQEKQRKSLRQAANCDEFSRCTAFAQKITCVPSFQFHCEKEAKRDGIWSPTLRNGFIGTASSRNAYIQIVENSDWILKDQIERDCRRANASAGPSRELKDFFLMGALNQFGIEPKLAQQRSANFGSISN